MKELKSIFSHVWSFFKKTATTVNWQQLITTVLPIMAAAAQNILILTGNGADAVIVGLVVGKIQGGFAQISALTENYTAATHTGYIAQVQAIADDIQANMSGLTGEAGIKDPALLANVQKWVTLIDTDLKNLLGSIPATPPTPAGTTPADA